jgi:hypothetical protein
VTIHQIQIGHQIILMYNLVVSERVGGLLLSTPNQSRMCFTNHSNFPLYARVKNLLESPGFMNQGILPSLPISFISSNTTFRRKTWSLLPLCILSHKGQYEENNAASTSRHRHSLLQHPPLSGPEARSPTTVRHFDDR